jgi:hypothetical protein
MNLQWFSQHSISFTLIVAYIPLIATVVTTVMSLILARATLRYVEASDKSLALAREEFDRQWSPTSPKSRFCCRWYRCAGYRWVYQLSATS